ncbi:cysteine hydrolase family protein [Parasphaerochaeta coccoides]|uniref:Isochorismatase-like domain-containing protein n=1 Tax=Parasphaerochaeta coccoides (strain ATCC BAA-1237 / DSM 17374 / SPN1) TaxID=760011 RepID=F4GKD0_PARC1|nr:isochorismatase family cysteine hydrolase [Parasphaerochaeta coccoides]AEC02326.1 conserved hypothetical protein, putative amidase [Parasphaerochaeta coccoides DSM 17374]
MKQVLIVVDFQNDFVTGTLGFPGATKLEGPIVEKIKQFKDAGDDVIFTLDTHQEDYRGTEEGRNLPIEHCIKGTPGWELYGKVADCVDAASVIFEKPTFGSMSLARHLAEKRYNRVELIGLVSNICVLANALLAKAALPDAHVVVDARCTASGDASLHEKALDILAGVHVEVIGR